ncbi:MAG: TolC family outer membrane protein [Pseudomonadota bacterium]
MGSPRKTAGLAALAVAVAAAAGPAAVRAESLADAMVMAVRNSPELALNRANVRVLSEQAVQAAAGGRTQVSGTASITAQFSDLREFRYPTALQLDVTQPLYTGGQVENATEAAEIRITAEEARLIASEQLVLLNTVTSYSDVRRDLTLVSLGRNNVRVISEQLRAARERFDVGEVTRTDVAQAEARLAAARSTLAARVGQLEISKEAYKRVVGAYPGELDPPPPLPDLPDDFDQAISISMVDQPAIRAARLERNAAKTDVRTAIGALLPQVSLLGQVRNQDILGIESDSLSDASVGLQIQIPIYSGGANYSNIREAQAQVEGRSADITTALKDTAEQVGTAWADLKVAKATIKAGRLEVRAARIAFEGVQEEAKVGARTTLDVLDAEQELLDARGSLVSARRDEYVASYNLLFSVGKLTTDHLGLDMGDGAEPEAYYAAVKERNFSYDRTDDTVWTLSYRP